MFSELPKLLGRNFAVGFFLPFAIFLSLLAFLLHGFGAEPAWLRAFPSELLVGTTVAALVSWVGGLVLLGINRPAYRILEGYGLFNPVRLLGWLQRWNEARRQDEIEQLYVEERNACAGSALHTTLYRRRARLMWQHAERFPRRPDLLPTAFGNAIRAFETYPAVMYGLDDINGWTRLLAVVPRDFRTIVDDAKAQTDFWLNQWLVAVLLLVAYAAVAIETRTLALPWFPVALVVYAWVASRCATTAAVEWGDTVKAAYDVYLPKLRKQLELAPPADREADRSSWEAFSEAILYRDPALLPPIAPPPAAGRPADPPQPAPSQPDNDDKADEGDEDKEEDDDED